MKKVEGVEIWFVKWYEHEYEPGWGPTDRPDGISLHVSEEEAKAYIKGVEQRNKKQSSSGYHLSMHPVGKPKRKVLTSSEVSEKLKKDKTLRFWQSDSEEVLQHIV